MVWLWANHKAVNAAKGWLKFDRHCRRIQNVMGLFSLSWSLFFLFIITHLRMQKICCSLIGHYLVFTCQLPGTKYVCFQILQMCETTQLSPAFTASE